MLRSFIWDETRGTQEKLVTDCTGPRGSPHSCHVPVLPRGAFLPHQTAGATAPSCASLPRSVALTAQGLSTPARGRVRKLVAVTCRGPASPGSRRVPSGCASCERLTLEAAGGLCPGVGGVAGRSRKGGATGREGEQGEGPATERSG